MYIIISRTTTKENNMKRQSQKPTEIYNRILKNTNSAKEGRKGEQNQKQGTNGNKY